MQSRVPEPDFLPEPIRGWAHEHRDVLELITQELLKTGSWPSVKGLTRTLARRSQPVPLRSLLTGMPKPLGFVEPGPDRVVLHLFGLRMTPAGQRPLAGFLVLLHLALERFQGADETPVISRADAAHATSADTTHVRALSEIVLREAPFVGSGTGSEDDDWTREVTDDVMRYAGVATIDDYLRIRADELRSLPHLGWAVTPAPRPAPTPTQPSAWRDVFLSHAGEDELVARALAQALVARGHSVWYDEAELVIGDSLSEHIDRGLAQSHFGVVILSAAFLAKPWPRRELEGLVARETADGRHLILPVWHGIDQHDLVQRAPALAGRLAVSTARGVDHVADEISRAIRRRGRQDH